MTPVSAGVLVATNLVPLVGVLFFGWSIATILVAYWVENGIVGLINVPKMLIAGSARPRLKANAKTAALTGFFVAHYGAFWLGHGFFVFLLIGGMGFLPGSFFGDPFAQTSPVQALDTANVALLAVLLLISHGTSFFVNYIGKGEYRRTTPAQQMAAPYGRLIILHVTIVIGAFFVIFLGQPAALVALLVAFKTVGDLALHLREHATPPLSTAEADSGAA